MTARTTAPAFGRAALLAVAAAALALAAAPSRADVDDRPYDFSDAYYLRNGVNPARIVNRVNGTPPRSRPDAPFFASQRAVRVTRTNPAYSHSGDPTFWVVAGDIDATGFTADAAGRRAKQVADSMVLYVFPRHDQPDPVALGANRQADIVDLRHGYFSNNPLGLWLHTWVHYTPPAFATAGGQKALADLAKRNGLAADGTPIIRTLSELDGLVGKGYAEKRLRKADGSEGTMYGICPVIEDPTGGGIAPDATLSYVRKPDGSPLEPGFLVNFESLRTTGKWFD